MTETTHRITVYQSGTEQLSAGTGLGRRNAHLLLVSLSDRAGDLAGDFFGSVLHCSFSEPLPVRPGIWSKLRVALRFVRRLVREVPTCDVVQVVESVNVPFLLFTLPTILISRFFGKRIVLETNVARTEKVLEKWRFVVMPILRQADAIIVASAFASQAVGRFGLRGQIIPPHVDCDRVPGRVISGLQPRLLCARPLEHDMNYLCLLRAYKLLKQKYPRAELVIATESSGDDPLVRSEIERFVAGEHLSGIHMVTLAGGDNLDELLAGCDLMVSSSSRDDLPHVFLLAMAAGLPIVSTDAGGIPELAYHTDSVVLVPLNDHTRMAERIIRLIEDSDLVRRLSQESRDTARTFSAQRVRVAWADAYGSEP